MTEMRRVGMRNASAHLGRLVLAALAVLGVTFVSGSLVLTATSQTIPDEQFGTIASGALVAVRRAVASDAARGVEVTRGPVPPSALATIRSVPGVAQVQPVARGQGLLMLGSRPVVPALLESWSPAPFNSYRLQVGHAPAADDEVALDLSTALAQRIRLGDTVDVQGLQSGTFRDQGETMIAKMSAIGT